MCGASDEQKQVWAQQSSFMNDLSANYKTVFGESQAILGDLTAGLSSIFEAGPNQRGFSDQQRSILNTQSAEAASRSYSKASEAVGAAEAARGGDTVVPSGQDAALQGKLATAATSERNALEQKVTMADYDTGRQNWQFAAEGLGKVAGLENPQGYADAFNTASKNAEGTANDMYSAEKDKWDRIWSGVSAGLSAATAGLG